MGNLVSPAAVWHRIGDPVGSSAWRAEVGDGSVTVELYDDEVECHPTVVQLRAELARLTVLGDALAAVVSAAGGDDALDAWRRR